MVNVTAQGCWGAHFGAGDSADFPRYPIQRRQRRIACTSHVSLLLWLQKGFRKGYPHAPPKVGTRPLGTFRLGPVTGPSARRPSALIEASSCLLVVRLKLGVQRQASKIEIDKPVASNPPFKTAIRSLPRYLTYLPIIRVPPRKKILDSCLQVLIEILLVS